MRGRAAVAGVVAAQQEGPGFKSQPGQHQPVWCLQCTSSFLLIAIFIYLTMCTSHHAATLLGRCVAQLAAVVWFSKSLWCIYLIQTILLSFRLLMYAQDVWICTLSKLVRRLHLFYEELLTSSCFPSTFSPVKCPKQVFLEHSTTLTMLLLKDKKIGQLMNRLPWGKKWINELEGIGTLFIYSWPQIWKTIKFYFYCLCSFSPVSSLLYLIVPLHPPSRNYQAVQLFLFVI